MTTQGGLEEKIYNPLLQIPIAIVQNKKIKVVGYILYIIIFLGLLTRTIIRNIDWKNEDNLRIATGKTSPSYHVTHNNLGDVYGRRGNMDRSIAEFKKAIEIKPDYADAYHNLGNTYRQIGKLEEAKKNYETAFKLNPYLWQSPMNLAAIYFEQASYASAEVYMKQAIKIFPQNSYLYSNLGVIYLKAGEIKKSEKEFLTALEIDPDNQQARAGLLEIQDMKN